MTLLTHFEYIFNMRVLREVQLTWHLNMLLLYIPVALLNTSKREPYRKFDDPLLQAPTMQYMWKYCLKSHIEWCAFIPFTDTFKWIPVTITTDMNMVISLKRYYTFLTVMLHFEFIVLPWIKQFAPLVFDLHWIEIVQVFSLTYNLEWL